MLMTVLEDMENSDEEEYINDPTTQKKKKIKKKLSDKELLSELKEKKTTIRSNNEIMKATEEALLNEICNASTEFMQQFIWTHTLYMTSSKMIDGLFQRFYWTIGNESKKSLEIRMRIMNALRYILMNCWGTISNKNETQSIFQEFCQTLEKYNMAKQASMFMGLLEKRIAGIDVKYVELKKDSPPYLPLFSEITGNDPVYYYFNEYTMKKNNDDVHYGNYSNSQSNYMNSNSVTNGNSTYLNENEMESKESQEIKRIDDEIESIDDELKELEMIDTTQMEPEELNDFKEYIIHLKKLKENCQKEKEEKEKQLQQQREIKQKEIEHEKELQIGGKQLTNNKIDILDMSPIEFARQMTLLIHNTFSKIKLYEFFKWTTDKKSCKTIQSLLMFYNSFIWYFQNRIILSKTEHERLFVLKQLICIASHCKTLNNFDTIGCIMDIFTSSPIYRLQKTFNKLDKTTKNKYQRLVEFMSPNQSYQNLRNAFMEARKNSVPCVPYIKVFLEDMTFISDGNITKTEDGLINFDKCRQMCSVVRCFDDLISKKYAITPYQPIKEYIESIHSDNYEMQNYERSKMIEPNDSIQLHFIENGNVIERNIGPETPLKETFGDAIMAAFFSGLLENKIIENKYSLRSVIGNDKNLLTQSIIMPFKQPKYIPFIFQYDSKYVFMSLPIDMSKPLYHSYPIIYTYMSQPYPFIVLMISEEYKVIGLANPNEILSKDDDKLYFYFLLPLDYFIDQHSKLTDDLPSLQKANNFCRFDFKKGEQEYSLLLVDNFVCIYHENEIVTVCPMDFTHINILPRNQIAYFEQIPGSQIVKRYYNQNNPLILECSQEDFISIIQRLRKYSITYSDYLMAVQPHQTTLVNGIPPLVNELLMRIYTDDDYYSKDRFVQTNGNTNIWNVIDKFNHGIIDGTIDDYLQMMKLYLITSCGNLFMSIEEESLLSFNGKDDTYKLSLLKQWCEEIYPPVLPIYIRLFKIFKYYMLYYQQINFDDWGKICISNVENANDILIFVINHIEILEQLPYTQQFSLQIISHDVRSHIFKTNDFYFVEKQIENAFHTPTSIINLINRKNTKLSMFPKQETPFEQTFIISDNVQTRFKSATTISINDIKSINEFKLNTIIDAPETPKSKRNQSNVLPSFYKRNQNGEQQLTTSLSNTNFLGQNRRNSSQNNIQRSNSHSELKRNIDPDLVQVKERVLTPIDVTKKSQPKIDAKESESMKKRKINSNRTRRAGFKNLDISDIIEQSENTGNGDVDIEN